MKRNIIIHYNKLSDELKAALELSFPFGYDEKIINYQNVATGKGYRGLVFSYDNTTYLIKFELNNIDISDDENNEIDELDEINKK